MEQLKIVLSSKQKSAWRHLTNITTNEILYGGGAGGGKSFLGCLWLINNCIAYPGSRWLMGRAVLKALKESTLKTFRDLIHDLKWSSIVKINEINGTIKFNNGSEIIMKDLFRYPADPNFESLGSTEYTGAFIDEASQIGETAKNIVFSRIRYKLDKFGLVPKILICSNPAKNWMYSEFYKPNKEGKLQDDRIFIQSLVTDNPHISPHYIKSLHKLDPISKQRLLFGNWEYDDTLGRLFKYENILNMFTNSFVEEGEKYLTCDVARKGSDKCIIYLWSGLRVIKVITYDLSLTTMIENTILEIAEKYSVPRSNIVIDEDGVGGGVVDHLPGCYGFVNGSSALNGENYMNLKSQCAFKAGELVEQNKIYFGVEDIEAKEKLTEEMEQQTQKDPDKDGKLMIVGKKVIKENIGRSPDYFDALMMRMVFEVMPKESFSTAQPLNIAF